MGGDLRRKGEGKMKQVIFEKDGIEIYDDGSHFEGWHIKSKKAEYLAVADDGYFHLCDTEGYPNEPCIVENICTCDDDDAYEKIIEAVQKEEK